MYSSLSRLKTWIGQITLVVKNKTKFYFSTHKERLKNASLAGRPNGVFFAPAVIKSVVRELSLNAPFQRSQLKNAPVQWQPKIAREALANYYFAEKRVAAVAVYQKRFCVCVCQGTRRGIITFFIRSGLHVFNPLVHAHKI